MPMDVLRFGYTVRRTVRRSYNKNRDELMGWILRRHARFILTDHADTLEDVPVFDFHRVTEEDLEPLLLYMSENGYRTLTADLLYERQSDKRHFCDREVVLTFDDGDKSLWSVAYPLLKKYGFTGVAFIVPGAVPGDGAGSRSGYSDQELCTWSDIREMHRSGVIDFQSHSLYHHTVFVSPRIIDFAAPSQRLTFLRNDLFPVLELAEGTLFPDGLPWGTPIYESAPRLAGKPRYLDSPGLRQACVEFVRASGGASFFQDPRWRPRLGSFVRDVFPAFSTEERYERPEERREAIYQDLHRAEQILEAELDGKKVRHLCFPWYVADRLTVEVSQELGYLTNFWGPLLPKQCRSDKLPIPIPRSNPLYIWRLPGRGRKSVGGVLQLRFSEILQKWFGQG